MSDKHTDALQAYALEETQQGVGYMEPAVDGDWFKRADVEAKIRATEGQAQTSAAAPGLSFHGYSDADEHFGETILDYMRSRGEVGTNDLKVGDVLDVTAMWTQDQKWRVTCEGNPFEVERISPAAQLADSTAPGAPVDPDDSLNLCLSDLEHSSIYDSPREMVDCMKAVIKRIRALAAPTAQQSLTAGGAVPELVSELVKVLGLVYAEISPSISHDKYVSIVDEVNRVRKLAAAPLPQVQSESIPNGVYFSASANNFYDMMTKTGMGGDFFMKWRERSGMFPQDDFRANRAGDLSQWLPRAADQQPVTPSGALADNDGGVA